MSLKKLILFTILLLLATACGRDNENDTYEEPLPPIIDTPTGEAPAAIDTFTNNEAADYAHNNDLPEFTPSIPPAGLHNTGENLLMDSDFNFIIQFPEEWYFLSVAEFIAGREYTWGMTFEELVEMNPYFARMPFMAMVGKSLPFGREREYTEMGSIIMEPIVGILYWNFPEGYTIHEIARHEVQRQNFINERFAEQGILNESSFVGELEQISIDGVIAYRYMQRRDLRLGTVGGDTEDFVEVRYVYLLPLSDSIYARFELSMADANLEADAEIIELFRTAMEGLKWV